MAWFKIAKSDWAHLLTVDVHDRRGQLRQPCLDDRYGKALRLLAMAKHPDAISKSATIRVLHHQPQLLWPVPARVDDVGTVEPDYVLVQKSRLVRDLIHHVDLALLYLPFGEADVFCNHEIVTPCPAEMHCPERAHAKKFMHLQIVEITQRPKVAAYILVDLIKLCA